MSTIIEKNEKVYEKDIYKVTKLHSKQELLLVSLLKFYENENYKNLMVSIVRQQTAISLRLLDWLVTNYSKKYSVRYDVSKKDILEKNTEEYIKHDNNFNLWLDYKNQLKAYSKKLFDPFSRRQRIFYNIVTNNTTVLDDSDYDMYVNDKNGIITTVGQLCFFKWAIANKVIDYAFAHIEDIESDMLKSADKRTERKNSGPKRMLSGPNGSKSQKFKIVIQFQ